MPNKEFQIANRAKDLLIYTIKVAKPVGDKSIDAKDVMTAMTKVGKMSHEEVAAYCENVVDRLRKSSKKQGFPKSAQNTIVNPIRKAVHEIVEYIQMANDVNFMSEYDKRLEYIDEVVKRCNLALVLISVSLELKYISIKRGEAWTNHVLNVKHMALAWRRKDAERAKELRERDKAAEYEKLVKLILENLQKAKNI